MWPPQIALVLLITICRSTHGDISNALQEHLRAFPTNPSMERQNLRQKPTRSTHIPREDILRLGIEDENQYKALDKNQDITYLLNTLNQQRQSLQKRSSPKLNLRDTVLNLNVYGPQKIKENVYRNKYAYNAQSAFGQPKYKKHVNHHDHYRQHEHQDHHNYHDLQDRHDHHYYHDQHNQNRYDSHENHDLHDRHDNDDHHDNYDHHDWYHQDQHSNHRDRHDNYERGKLGIGRSIQQQRSPAIKSLLRISNDLLCEKEQKCEDKCSEKEEEQENRCVNKCEKKFKCKDVDEDSLSTSKSNECNDWQDDCQTLPDHLTRKTRSTPYISTKGILEFDPGSHMAG